MKIVLLVIAVASLASCSKIKKEQKCYTCTYSNSLDSEDFCGTDKELEQYKEFKISQRKPVTCR